jgi:ketosteroid isomerase-like protein
MFFAAPQALKTPTLKGALQFSLSKVLSFLSILKEMKTIILLSLLLLCTSLATSAQTKDELAIRKLLSEQDAAWNRGDIETFMQGYWKSDSLMFIGKSGITYGWQKTLDNYKEHYPDTAAMGKLDFEYIEIKRLSAIYFFVVGKWHLTRTIGNLDGSFTLLLRKIKGKWVIVKDHSS